MQNNGNKNLLAVIGLAVLFGLGSGLVGELIARVYLLDNLYSLPMFGDINYAGGSARSNLIIREAKNVIVEQNDKLAEVIKSSRDSLVGIIRNPANEKMAEPVLADYLSPSDVTGQGLILTSDGWIITNLSSLGDKPSDTKDYLVVTPNGVLLSIDRIVKDKLSRFVFLKVSAKDLPVKKFAAQDSVQNGQLVVTPDWRGVGEPNYVVARKYLSATRLLSSDSFGDRLILDQAPRPDFAGPAIFNLAGEVIGLTDDQGRSEPIHHYGAVIATLFKDKAIRRSSLGVNYIDLSGLIDTRAQAEPRPENSSAGALLSKNGKNPAVQKKSAADKAGLREGDVISAVNGIALSADHNLSDATLALPPGEIIVVDYLRSGKDLEAKIKLGELQ